MSTLKNPVGPQSPKVYWRRRILVLLGLLAVIIVVVLIVVRPGASADEQKDSASNPAATDAASTAIPTEDAAAEGAPCDASNVLVEALTNADVFAPGDSPELSVQLTNTGTEACVINAGTSGQVFTITSGEEAYWTSTDCQTDAVDADVVLEPNVPISSAAPIVWDRTRSSVDTCDGEREAVPSGGASYHLTVTVAGIESAATKQFILN